MHCRLVIYFGHGKASLINQTKNGLSIEERPGAAKNSESETKGKCNDRLKGNDPSVSQLWVQNICCLESLASGFHFLFPSSLWDGKTRFYFNFFPTSA